MAEWKTDTEEVKKVVGRCREFKQTLQKDKCGGFIKDLDSYALKIIVECRKTEMQLEKAIGELNAARKKRRGFWGSVLDFYGGFCDAVSPIFPPAKLGAKACEKGLNLMEDNIEKWEHNVSLLERMLEIYSNQAKASADLMNQAWEGIKKRLHFYTDKHQEFIRRLKQASDAIDNEYNFPTPGVLMEYDFERPAISYTPKKSVFNERLKDLRENFSTSLYADLKDKINAFSHRDRAKASKEREWDLAGADKESLTLAKNRCVKNIKEALEGFTKKIKESHNDSNAVNEAFNDLKTELERAIDDEHLKDLRENFASLYADLCTDLKDKINAFSYRDRAKASKERELEKNLEDLTPSFRDKTNALSGDDLERLAISKEKELEKDLEDLMPSVLSVPSYNESLTLAKNRCVKNCKKALEGFAEKIKEAPNDSNAINEAFDSLETELERATENLSQKIDPVLERNENYAQKALEYREFLESRKEGFIVDEQNPYPEEVRFNEWRLAEFDSVFSAIVPLEDLNKTACAHHALKALQAALKDNDLGFDATELEQIAKGFIPRGYLWHFDANVLGNVALVREELLLGVKHTKGYSLWTEFLQKQN
ncbi:5-methyltetrahydrofolate--homocysteine methyltransferase [Helicobacter pylori]|uniref:HNH endonuclease n=1 Tax=Helicobacter pylori TaxID=210 RepID=UPI0009A3C7C7|nr:HNH endonuclease [Helicobacter pylori]NHA20103.1 5-methyltetrahydrofolate--homocysteine methyltransferase [Helicobacter pylori]OPG22355.1 5-methyltetrahydrofolate--homocysteine methyltransferase [Helicobacter pylori]QEF26845.1 5-methyltetrahydrofolate--homocysteine methyltransferase [Helicobacter pylori]